MAQPIQQKVIGVQSGGAMPAQIDAVLQEQGLLGWRLVSTSTYGIQSYGNPGGIYLFFVKD